ncbi:MAG TPA: SPOR domain-containing protein, partial [Gemmatimonadales bacterium]
AAASAPATSRPAARPATTPPPRGGNFSVQVAAFDRVAPAEALVADLREKGIDARIDADEQWHRVRIGYFATREEAAALAKRLKESGITGFVTGIGR